MATNSLVGTGGNSRMRKSALGEWRSLSPLSGSGSPSAGLEVLETSPVS